MIRSLKCLIRSAAGRRRLSQAARAAGIVLAVCGCSETPLAPRGPAQTAPGPVIGDAITDADGAAALRLFAGRVVLCVTLQDSSGAPVPDERVTLIAGRDQSLIALGDAREGRSGGTLLLELGAAMLLRATDSVRADFAVIPGRPGRARLLDLEVPGIDADARSLAAGCGTVTAYDRLVGFLRTVAGYADQGVVPLAQLMEEGAFSDREILIFHPAAAASSAPVTMRRGRADAWPPAADLALHVFRPLVTDAPWAVLPMGPAPRIELEQPLQGEVFAGPAEQELTLEGRLAAPAALLAAYGARLELRRDGVRLDAAGSAELRPAGDGSRFVWDKPLALVPGEQRLSVALLLPPLLQGFAPQCSGAPAAERRVIYEPDPAASPAPVLSTFSYPREGPVPAGRLALSFHFADPESDIVAAHERLSWSMGGQTGSWSGSAHPADDPSLAVLQDPAGECLVILSYSGAVPGDWIEWRFWVTDAAGHASHPLRARIVMTGPQTAGGDSSAVILSVEPVTW
ncbi:MAG: hypothetical protein GF355_07720 [Candidatus Eisenbacteria bacterium]|nr:hypothetical protein [Candidatus Eisenbacteria bacterium]